MGTLHARRAHHRADVVHAILDRPQPERALGEADALLVEHRHAPHPGQLDEEAAYAPISHW